jgi:hypothetical protein
MRGRGPLYASPSQVASGNLTLKIKRGGVGRQSGSGPSGRTATPRAVLSRSLRDRAGVAKVVTERQAARVARKKHPPKVIYGAIDALGSKC